MRYIFLFLLIVGAFWFGVYAVEHSSDVSIKFQWNENPISVSLTSTTLLIAAVLSLVGMYLLVTLLKFLFGLRKRFKNHRQMKLSAKANQELTKGLVHFTEGHWVKSEEVLLNTVKHSEAPLLNYLAAARAAHMQEAYDRRDSYLKTASEQGDDARIAVSVSQAEMQFTSNQLEQARATLIHLLELSPKHPYALKLLAKVYYQQQDWSNLFSILPDLDQLSLIKESDCEKYETTALTGIFHSLSFDKKPADLKALWKKLPVGIREKSPAILLYIQALDSAGDESASHKLLVNQLNKEWDENLVEYYGQIEHVNLGAAIKQGEKWLLENEKSPMLLLALARLNRKFQLWGKSKAFYNASLNFSPSAAGYLELAELLEELEEFDNAQVCYKQGLQYSIHQKGAVLTLKPARNVDPSLAIVPDSTEDMYSI